MLLSLMMNLNMFGGNVPTPPPPFVPSGETGGGGRYRKIQEIETEERESIRKKVLEDDQEILLILKAFLQSKN